MEGNSDTKEAKLRGSRGVWVVLVERESEGCVDEFGNARGTPDSSLDMEVWLR